MVRLAVMGRDVVCNFARIIGISTRRAPKSSVFVALLIDLRVPVKASSSNVRCWYIEVMRPLAGEIVKIEESNTISRLHPRHVVCIELHLVIGVSSRVCHIPVTCHRTAEHRRLFQMLLQQNVD